VVGAPRSYRIRYLGRQLKMAAVRDRFRLHHHLTVARELRIERLCSFNLQKQTREGDVLLSARWVGQIAIQSALDNKLISQQRSSINNVAN